MSVRIETLRNLRPETILGLENVPFSKKAEALPNVESVHFSITDVPYLKEASSDLDDDFDEEIDVKEAMRLAPEHEERMLVVGGHVVAGGLVYDQDAGHLDPFEDGTSNGKLYHYGSRGSAEENGKFLEALGYTADGDKDLECQGVSKRLVDKVMRAIGNDRSLLMRLLHCLRNTKREVSKESLRRVVQYAVDQGGWKSALDYLADDLFGVAYWTRLSADQRDKFAALEAMFSEEIAEEAWSEAMDAGELGAELAQTIDIYEHGGRHYSLSGEGMQCCFDTSRCGAVWVPDEDALDNIRSSALHQIGVGQVRWFGAAGSETDPLHARYTLDGGTTWVGEGKAWSWKAALDAMVAAHGKVSRKELDAVMEQQARNYCRGILEEFNAWANGDVHGIVIYVIDRTTGERIEELDEEVWGFVGSQYAEEELEVMMLSTALSLQNKH